MNREFLARINHSGKFHMIPAMVRGKYVIRFCVTYEHATDKHIRKYYSSSSYIILEQPEPANNPNNELFSFATDEAWKEIQGFAEDVLESQSPNEPLQPIQPIVKKTKRKLTRTMSARFSFTRSVSREIYEQQLNNSGLTDGCTPICILDTSEILDTLQKATKKNLQRATEVDIDSTDEASN